MYLIYTTEQEAWVRSEQEGIARNHAFHVVGSGTRYVSSPKRTEDDEFALPVDGFSLTEEEQAAAVATFTPPPEVEEI